MERVPTPLTEEAVTRIEAADDALEEGTAEGDYDGCLFCQVDVVLELVAERLRGAGFGVAASSVLGP
jgi:hypothetical protein